MGGERGRRGSKWFNAAAKCAINGLTGTAARRSRAARGSRAYFPWPYQETEQAMATFNDREKAFEDKYKHDQELQFRTEVRRNKLLGLWVASELLGLAGDAAEAYAKAVVSSDFEQPGHDDVVRTVMSDHPSKGVEQNRKSVDWGTRVAE